MKEELSIKILSIRLMNFRIVGDIRGNLKFAQDEIQFLTKEEFRKNVDFHLMEYKFRNDNIPLLVELTLGILIETSTNIDENNTKTQLRKKFEEEFNKIIKFLQATENLDNK